MENPLQNYWRLRLERTQAALAENNFEVFLATTTQQAAETALLQIIPASKAVSVSWGGSMTFVTSGLYDRIKAQEELEIIDTFDKSLDAAASLERRRQALLADLFITGANAITEKGQLVNLDMYGNRVAGLTFGPKHVIVMAGRNKIVPDLQAAMNRIKAIAAPANTMRLDKKTPCVKTGVCQECKSPDRICNVWTITEKSFPKGRIKVILIDDELGL
jgi:L-lactate utilization protein LutC